VKELKGFQKISLKAGESRVVTFTLTPDDLAFYRADMTWGSEPGTFDLFIGGNSADVKNVSFELKDESL
jgi:beta-glucosidase